MVMAATKPKNRLPEELAITSPDGNGEPQEPIKPEEAKAAIEADRRARLARCEAKVNEALREEKCALEPIMVLKNNSVQAEVRVVAVE